VGAAVGNGSYTRGVSTPSVVPEPEGHLELPVAEQLARARPWDPARGPVVDDLTDDEEADFLTAIQR
jgi:hypothetical protein